VDSFWTSIRREVLINVNTDDLEHASLDALAALSRAFTTDGEFNSPAFTKLLKNVLTGKCVVNIRLRAYLTVDCLLIECQGHLCEPERRLMTPSSYILLAICSGSAPACALIVSQVLFLFSYGTTNIFKIYLTETHFSK
jgi:hypothetical protein